MGSVLDSIRSVQESIERIAKQTGTEHLFGDIGYVLGLEDKDKGKNKSTEETQKSDTQNTSDINVDKPTTSESKSVTDTIRDILSTVDKIALESGTERLFENLDEVLGIKQEEKKIGEAEQNQLSPQFDAESSFTSSGTRKFKRYYQALRYDPDRRKNTPYVYGMDCNACCMMYFLQSYGLIPPDISRKIFEYLFTPLNPPKAVRPSSSDESAYSANQEPKNKTGVKIGRNLAIPVENLLDGIFATGAGDFLRGINDAIFPHYPNGIDKLTQVYDKFANLSYTKGYEFLQENHEKYYNLNYMGLRNKYADLQKGITDEEYFEKNVIFVGIHDTDPPYPAHYCIIVSIPTQKTIDGINFWEYLADDPFYGNTKVYVPKTNLDDWLGVSAKIRAIGNKYFSIFPNCAIGV